MADRVVVETVDIEPVESEFWWMGVLGGILTMLFGIAALFWPGLTLVTFVYLFSAYMLVWGVVSVVKGLVDLTSGVAMWWLSLIFGFIGIGVGVYLVRHPLASFATLVLLIGFTFIIRGVIDVVSGFSAGQSSTGRMLSFIAGGLGILAGVFMLTQPAEAGVAFVWILGLYSLLVGPLLIAMAIDVHNNSGVLE